MYARDIGTYDSYGFDDVKNIAYIDRKFYYISGYLVFINQNGDLALTLENNYIK